jgi:molybdenum cofactor cytidylyltransferase
MRCFAVLLAAGFSSRFENGNKLLAPFRGKPLARHTLDLVCGMNQCGQSRFEKIFFVYADDSVAALAQDTLVSDALASSMPVTFIRNNAPEKGRGESARLGVAAADAFLSGKTEDAYYMFFPCDQPLLDAATVELILEAARPGCIAEPCFHGNPYSPSLFSTTFRDEILALSPGTTPRLLKSRHPEAVIKVEVPEPAVLADVDTIDDLEQVASSRCYLLS